MGPIKFLHWVLTIAFMVGLADSFGRLTYQMATAAVHAHQFDQISYGKFSRMLWSPPKRPEPAKKKPKPEP